MANTLKLGNGKWATGKDTVMSFNDENNNFKPLPFDFSRASSATVVNQSGLIETVGSGEPRIDFLGNTKGALKLEPQRTNLTLYSEDLSNSYWAKQNGSITSNVISSPNGLVNADLFTENTSTGDHAIFDIVSYFVSGTTYTISFFAKSNGRTRLEIASANSGTCPTGRFDLEAKTANATNSSFGAKIEDYGNGWFKCSVSRVAPNSGQDLPYYATVINFGTLSYAGDGTSGMYLWGMQTEEGSYATSYIPTSGQSGGVTRVGDVCNNGGNAQVINSSEGVLYAEISALANDGTTRAISINDGSTDNFVQFSFRPTTNSIRYRLESGNVVQFSDEVLLTDTTTFNKIALVYGNNNFALWSNGVRKLLRTNPSSPINLLNLDFDNGENLSPFYGNVKDIKLYNTVLTDQELIALTTI